MDAPHPLRRILRSLAVFVAVGCGLALAVADLFPIDAGAPSPVASVLELFAVRADALRFQFGVLAGICGALLLLTWFPRWALLAAVISLWGILPVLHALRTTPRPAAGDARLRVLSMNLAVDRAENARVLKEIRDADPDLILFQEYTPKRAVDLRPVLEAGYPTRFERPRTDSFGMALYARVPVEDISRFHLADSLTPHLRFRVQLGDRPMVVYGIHLVPIHAGLYDKQRRQFTELLERVEGERDAVLVGDFNFVTHGALAQALRERGYADSHALAGRGLGASWPVQLMEIGIPGVRIDHIFVSAALTCTDARIGSGTESDHLPISAVLAWKQAP